MAEEKNFENRIKKFLKDKKCYFFKYWGGGQFTKAGIPDIIGCVNGIFVGIEVKASNGRPSDLQIHNLKQIDNAGGLALLLYPEDFEDFKNLIELQSRYVTSPLIDDLYQKMKGRWESYGT